MALSYAVFRAGFDLTYLPIPFIIWAIFRFKMHGAVSAIIILSFASIYYTIRQQGPFAIMRGDQLSINDSLLLLELYIGVFTVMTMVLAATIQEREDYLVAERNYATIKAKGEFLITLSHEIRTPLNGVIGATELIKTTKLSAEQQKYVETLSGTAHTLASLVNNVLDYSKLEAGKLHLETIAFDPSAMLAEIKSMFANAAERKGLSFSIKSSGLPAAVQGDPLRITQILMNLSANALRFTEKGSVTVEALYRDGACTFSVTDTGIGMRREERERLFMPFQQAKRETARKFGGTGLGLSISAHLAELMQSHIDVESTEGKGSSFRFKVSLPETNASAIAANAESEVDAAFAQRIPLRILVVDDTDVNRMLTIAMLEKLGFQNIGECDDGFKAVDAILTGAYDVVLLDVQMPGMDGTEVARLVKDRMRKPPRLVAVTGNVETEDRQTYLKTMDDYIPKPFTFAMLMAALSRA
ncbi:integral membrane sensor hybrid histidine kinase [Turneriella parva DSM 21527]|uniref:histidine kinase n=2 Tax=Turneriella TaxID=338321 RepID=I4B0F4_TURPD|nr:integral membrane sensor hybrid histidine kinase [Turneriella parva DSM 21527]